MSATAAAERSVMAVREKSAIVICSARGDRTAKSASPNLGPRIEAFKSRSVEPLDSYSKMFGNCFAVEPVQVRLVPAVW